VNVQWDTELVGRPVVDEDGHRLGRVTTAYGTCTPDLYSVVWLVVRLPGIRRRWRAIPATEACWDDAGQTRLWVPYQRAQIQASPAVDHNALDDAARRNDVEQFYAAQTRISPAPDPSAVT